MSLIFQGLKAFISRRQFFQDIAICKEVNFLIGKVQGRFNENPEVYQFLLQLINLL